jgi:hypothetical protein
MMKSSHFKAAASAHFGLPISGCCHNRPRQ